MDKASENLKASKSAFILKETKSHKRMKSFIFKLKTKNAIKFFNEKYQNHKSLAVVGGVAANEKIRTELEQIANENSFNFFTVLENICSNSLEESKVF